MATDKSSIGYSPIGYKTPDVKLIALAVEKEKCFEATPENAYAGEYPLARFLYIYFNKNPNQPLTPLMAQFIKYIFSKEGQMTVVKDGFYPISRTLAGEDLQRLGIE